MSKKKDIKVCPVERAGSLESSLRRLFHNPRKIMNPYIHKGMTVLDFGCGPGFFTIEIAKLLLNDGKVIAADLQEGMLQKLSQKIKDTILESNIILRKCENIKISVTEDVDFILAFYVIHEVPDKEKIFNEFKSILKQNSKILIVEPCFHVSKKSFKEMITLLENIGFKITEKPKIFFSRSIVVEKK